MQCTDSVASGTVLLIDRLIGFLYVHSSISSDKLFVYLCTQYLIGLLGCVGFNFLSTLYILGISSILDVGLINIFN